MGSYSDPCTPARGTPNLFAADAECGKGLLRHQAARLSSGRPPAVQLCGVTPSWNIRLSLGSPGRRSCHKDCVQVFYRGGEERGWGARPQRAGACPRCFLRPAVTDNCEDGAALRMRPRPSLAEGAAPEPPTSREEPSRVCREEASFLPDK